MPTVKEIYDLLNVKAPFSFQEEWDNSGFLAGNPEREVSKILLALDITDRVIQEAVSTGADLIVSHHPLIFQPLKRVTLFADDLIGRKLWRLARHDIAIICCHTNLDAVEGGVNTVLAKALGLEQLTVLEPAGTDANGSGYGIGRVGVLPAPVAPEVFLRQVEFTLAPNGIRFVTTGRPIRKVAVGGGACGSMLHAAWAAGCDAFVTSDLKYNHFLDGEELGITLIDAGHFPTENPVMASVAQWLKDAYPDLSVLQSACHNEVIRYDSGENSR